MLEFIVKKEVELKEEKCDRTSSLKYFGKPIRYFCSRDKTDFEKVNLE